MAIISGNLRDSFVAVMDEVTEKTFVVAAAASDYVQVEPEININIKKDLKEREFINSSVGLAKPLTGMKSADASLVFEARSSGNGGVASDYHKIFKNALGTEVTRASDYTTLGTGSTTTTLDMNTGTGTNFAVGDLVLIKKGSGNTAARFVTGKATDTLTIAPALAAGEVPGTGVTVCGAVTYKPADTLGSLSLSVYWANAIREAVLGCKVKTLSVSNWKVGEIPKWSVGFSGLTYTRIAGAAPHTPTYNAQLPPVVLGSYAYQDAVAIQINDFSMSIDNDIVKLSDMTDPDGSFSQRLTKRQIKGSFSPFLDDTSVANFTAFNASTSFSLMVVIGQKDSNDDLVEGSVTAIYLPYCVFSDNGVANESGVMHEKLAFQAHRGDQGTSDEIYIGHS